MKLGEFAIFGALALGAHIAAFAAFGYRSDDGAGDDGTTDLTIQSAPADLADLVADWDNAPDVSTAPKLASPSPSDTPITERTTPDIAPNLLPQPQLSAPQTETNMTALPDAIEFARPVTDPMPLPQLTAPTVDRIPDQPKPIADLARAAPPARPIDSTSTASPKVDQTPPKKPAKQPAAKPAATANQKAKGKAPNKSSGTAGTSNTPQASVKSDGLMKSALSDWSGKVRHAIERRKFYPKGTKASGKVIVRLTLSTAGKLLSAEIATSSGDAILDQAAIKAVQSAKFPKSDAILNKPSYTFQIGITLKK